MAILASLLLAAAAVPALWLDANVVQERGFVALAAPLGEDAEFQAALSSAAGTAASTSLDLPPGLAGLVAPLVTTAAAALNTDPAYPAAWTETLARTHRLSVSAPGAAGQPDTLVLDVAPLLGLVVNRLAASVGAEITPPATMQIPLGTPANREVVSRLTQAGPVGWWLAVGAAAALALGLALARRRSTTVLSAGLGLAVVVAVWKGAATLAAGAVEAMDTGNPMAQLFKDRFVLAATASLDGWILAGALCAAVLVLAGGLARLVHRRAT
ncbi:hypothetical protein ACQCSX_09965 [Pseudarthrobacter sp. P1]|uniref:hypothetical protein n=1 Tax=Pseudarthrobacter sp. P1 TaxID=3418418 RepID=UPI003CEF49E7